MTKSAFVSFHYQRDYWRVQQVLQMGALDGQVELTHQKWEEVRRTGEAAVTAWIDQQMNYKKAVIVLVGNETGSRKFVQYGIRRAWIMRKPLLGIRIHGLKDSSGYTDAPGLNPFTSFGFSDSSKTYADFVPVYDPAAFTGKSYPSSSDNYNAIKTNIANWADNGYKQP
ncbi:TIR domain-containing protein [Rhodococcus qingshengii]|uniref:TIR domain-containing protein n=1 Tax=Rhodococcus qingshengii TaxID=334542 RepID=UPI0037C8FEB2